jgi:hypothetical protein
MVLNKRSLPRSAAEAPGFSFGLKNPTAVKAPGADFLRYPLPGHPRKSGL